MSPCSLNIPTHVSCINLKARMSTTCVCFEGRKGDAYIGENWDNAAWMVRTCMAPNSSHQLWSCGTLHVNNTYWIIEQTHMYIQQQQCRSSPSKRWWSLRAGRPVQQLPAASCSCCYWSIHCRPSWSSITGEACQQTAGPPWRERAGPEQRKHRETRDRINAVIDYSLLDAWPTCTCVLWLMTTIS